MAFGGSFGGFGGAAASQPTFGSSGAGFGSAGGAFGGGGSGAFGAPSSQPGFGSAAPAFGASSSSAFGGAASAPGFGASAAPAFGAAAPTAAFGAASAPAFGAAASAPFGAPAAAFGSAAPAFGAGSAAGFGAASAAAFGGAATGFGAAASAPAFGGGAQSAFGAASSSAFGAGANAFSAGGAPGFGAGGSAAFGSGSTSAFGGGSAPAFGSAAPAFGAGGGGSGGGLFGSASQQPAAGAATGFGGFGASAGTGGIGAASVGGTGTRNIKWALTSVSEGTPTQTNKYHSISMLVAQKFQQTKSVEELRLEDLSSGNPGAPVAPAAGGFGASTGFGASAQGVPAAGSVSAFGQSSSAPSGFGAFGAGASSAAGTAATGSSLFGSSTLPAGNSFSAFQTPNQQGTSAGPFGGSSAGGTSGGGVFGTGGSGSVFGTPAASFGASTGGTAAASTGFGLASSTPSFGGALQPQSLATGAVAAPTAFGSQPSQFGASVSPAAPQNFQVKLVGSTPTLVPFTGFSIPVGMTQTSPEIGEYTKLAENAYKAAQEAARAAEMARMRNDLGGIAFGLLLVAKDAQEKLDNMKRDIERRQAAATQKNPVSQSPGNNSKRRQPGGSNPALLTLEPGPLSLELPPRRPISVDGRGLRPGAPPAVSSLSARSGQKRHSMRSMVYSIGKGQEDRYKRIETKEDMAKNEPWTSPFARTAERSSLAVALTRRHGDESSVKENIPGNSPSVEIPAKSPPAWKGVTPTRFSKQAASSEVRRGNPLEKGLDRADGGSFDSRDSLPFNGQSGSSEPKLGVPAGDSGSLVRATRDVRYQDTSRTNTMSEVNPSPEIEIKDASAYRGRIRSLARRDGLPFDEDDPLDYLPVLTLEGYYMRPSVADMSRLTCHELTMIENFTVGREGHGEIRWLEPIDVRGIILDEAVSIDSCAVEVNPAVGRAEMLGDVLTTVTLNFGPGADENVIKGLCRENGTRFNSYSHETGELSLAISFY